MAYYQLDTIQLYYEVQGSGDPLLFIHGLGSSSRDWEYQIAHFADKYQLILVDVRGHGQSDKPAGPFTIAQFAADIARLLAGLGVAPVHVVGISMGGMIALQLTVDFPELVRSLVVTNAGSELVPRTWREHWLIQQRFLIVRLLGMRKMGEVLAGRLFPEVEHSAIRQTFVERWAENDKRAYLNAMRAIAGWSVTDRLDTITCPTLLIASDEDYTPLSDKEKVVARIPTAQLAIIENARHAVPVERPLLFNRTLENFLQQAP